MACEKKYNEALERAKKWEREHPHGYVIKDMMEYIFPELRESEDERIVRCIEVALTDVDEQRFKDFGTTLKDCIAYLEKQKEQKPWKVGANAYFTPEQKSEDRFKEAREKYQVEWSEEDEMMLNSIIATCELAEQDRHSGPSEHLLETQRIWLKSLRPSWKPSEEQMRALNAVIKHLLVETPERHRLEEIYEQLKELI